MLWDRNNEELTKKPTTHNIVGFLIPNLEFSGNIKLNLIHKDLEFFINTGLFCL